MDILKKLFRKHFILLVAIFFAVVSSHSLFHSGLIPTHDGEYHIVRFFEFDKSFRGGDFYPRWAPDLSNGFGIPLFNYVYPLPNYAALLSHALGFNFINSFKLSLLLSSIIGAVFMFLWAKDFWGEIGALISSIFYTFSPYHFVDIYIRGSVGEVWALAFFPAFLWSVTKFSKNSQAKYLVLSSVFLSLIIFSHNILGLMFFSFTILYCAFIFLKSKRRIIFSTLLMFILVLGITSIFWIPALFERQYVRGLEIYDYSTNFPEFYQLIFPSWGSGFSSDSLQNQLSFQIGIANLLALFGAIVLILRGKNRKILLFFIFSFLIVFFMMLKVSLPLWKIMPLFNYFQFPWRFLSLEILFTSFIAGSLVNFIKPKITAIFLITLSVVLGLGYSNSAYYLERNDSYYTTRSNFIDGTNSSGNTFNTIWMKDLKKQKEKLVFRTGNGMIFKKESKPTFYSFDVQTKGRSDLIANIAYFPGWVVYVDGENKKTAITRDGLFSFIVGQGKHQVIINFEDTNARKLGSLISLFSILALFAIPKFVKIKR